MTDREPDPAGEEPGHPETWDSLLRCWRDLLDIACPGCGYPLRDVPRPACPECGRALTREDLWRLPRPPDASRPAWADAQPGRLVYPLGSWRWFGVLVALTLVLGYVLDGASSWGVARRLGDALLLCFCAFVGLAAVDSIARWADNDLSFRTSRPPRLALTPWASLLRWLRGLVALAMVVCLALGTALVLIDAALG